MFDPRTLCSPAPFFHPLAIDAAGLLLRAALPKNLAARLPPDWRPPARLPVGILRNAQSLPVANSHFLLLEDDSTEALLAFMAAWKKGPSHRHLAYWIPRRFYGRYERVAARLLNGMLVPDEPELVSGWLSDHFKRPATWAELRAVLNFFQGLPADDTVLASSGVAKFFGDHGGREPARAQFFRIQHQCLQALLAHHRDALLEKNLAVVVSVRRESLLADRESRTQWGQLAQALGVDVVPVSCAVEDEPRLRTFVVHGALGSARDVQEPAWIRDADAAWRRVNPGKEPLR